jgi:pimeloyl-ACP methyl ester carboxylesterase
MGYAIAYSSFSSNGFDVDDGIRRTHQLRGLFDAKVGRPNRSYLVGQSLGSLVAEALVERYPGQYDGALLACGPLGGSEYEFNYIGNVRLLFDFFYPGVLPGQVDAIPNVDPITQIIGPAQVAIGANPTNVGILMQIDQIPLGGATLSEKIETLLKALAAHSRFVNDALDRVHGHFPFSNVSTQYTSTNPALSGLLAQLNATIPRYSATPDARVWLDHNYQPSGAIRFPVLTMHTNRDYFVPVQHEALFATTVAGAGASAFLSQRTIDAYGHCAFTVQQMVTGFTDLANWVVNDVRP